MPAYFMTQFAEATAHSSEGGGIFDVLGINAQMLLMQTVGFAILVVIMAKFIFPVFMKIVDERQRKIEASTKAAEEAEAKASESQAEIKKLLQQARKEAAEIVASAKEESEMLASESDKRAKARAEKIVTAAQEDIEKQVAAAKRLLHNETIELVALATEKVTAGALKEGVDNKVIEKAIKEAK